MYKGHTFVRIRNIDILFAVHLTDRNVHIQIIQLGKINYTYILKIPCLYYIVHY
jgi:hypothetical protein